MGRLPVQVYSDLCKAVADTTTSITERLLKSLELSELHASQYLRDDAQPIPVDLGADPSEAPSRLKVQLPSLAESLSQHGYLPKQQISVETLQKAFNYCAQDGDHAPLVVDLGGKCWTVMATKRPTESETTDSVPMALPSCVEGVSIRRANVTVTDGTLNLPDCALHCCAGNITLQGVHVVGRGPAPSLFTHSQALVIVGSDATGTPASCHFANTSISGSHGHGLAILQGSSCTLEECQILHNRKCGVRIHGPAASCRTPRDTVVANNGEHGTSVTGGGTLDAWKCNVLCNGGCGVFLGDHSSHGSLSERCSFSSNASHGISVTAGAMATCTAGCRFQGNQGAKIHVSGAGTRVTLSAAPHSAAPQTEPMVIKMGDGSEARGMLHSLFLHDLLAESDCLPDTTTLACMS